MLDGVPYRGPQGRGGEIGHTTVVIDGAQCECGARGCWETVASLQWLEAEADRLDLLPEGEFGVAQLAEMARSDAQAAGLLNQYAANLAVGISTLIRLLAPELVILHGEATLSGENAQGLHRARSRAQQTLEQVPVLNTDLEDRATLLGAAAVVLSDLLHRPTAT